MAARPARATLTPTTFWLEPLTLNGLDAYQRRLENPTPDRELQSAPGQGCGLQGTEPPPSLLPLVTLG